MATGLQYILAGYDISAYVQDESVDLTDTLGQGAGTYSAAAGRAKTLVFLTNRNLGSAANASGAGQTIHAPTLVRKGEIKVYDRATGTQLYGGFVNQLEDKTDRTSLFTQVTCVDYYQSLDSIVINEVFDGQTDNYILNYLLTKYASWVDRSALASVPAILTFPNLRLINKTLKDAIQMVATKTGYAVWITPAKVFQYQNPASLTPAPFTISDTPNYTTSFPAKITDYLVDDTAVINRVYFYGGKTLSPDFTQDLSPQADGTNTVFVLAYYPHHASDGKYHVYKSGVQLVLGIFGGTGAANTLKSKGGNADVLIAVDSHTLQFDVAPTAAQTPQCKYRYEYPLIVTVTNQPSHDFFGGWYDGTIGDQNVFSSQIATNRCKVLLAEQAYGLTTLKFTIWRAGIQAGQQITVVNGVRGINATFIVQTVEIKGNGGSGNYAYDVTCGAWNWNLVDLMNAVARSSQLDGSSDGSMVPVNIENVADSITVSSDTVSTITHTHGAYYARSAPVGDGHDAYPGWSTVNHI